MNHAKFELGYLKPMMKSFMNNNGLVKPNAKGIDQVEFSLLQTW